MMKPKKTPRKIDARLENLLYRTSKLETISETSAVISGFAIVALVEFAIDSYPDIPARHRLLTAYAIVSCLLISVHLFALLMSTCMLPEVKHVLHKKSIWIKTKDQEPLSTFSIYIEIAWMLSTGIGLLLVILELGLILWIKLAGYSVTAAISAIIILSIIGVPFIIFAVGFYIRMARVKASFHRKDLEAIERGAFVNTAYLRNDSTANSLANISTGH